MKSQALLTCGSGCDPTLGGMEITTLVRIPVYGLGCGGAGARTIERELARSGGVRRVYVNPVVETAYVDFDPTETDPTLLVEVIERAGYRAGRPVEA